MIIKPLETRLHFRHAVVMQYVEAAPPRARMASHTLRSLIGTCRRSTPACGARVSSLAKPELRSMSRTIVRVGFDARFISSLTQRDATRLVLHGMSETKTRRL